MNTSGRFSTVLALVSILFFTCKPASAQEVPTNPVSYRVFTPFVFNPAIAGSKDFLSVDLTAGVQGKANSQMLSFNTRLVKSTPGYSSSAGSVKFTKVGIGAYAFNDYDYNGSARNAGLGITGSYHIQLDKQHLRFLSVGASVKGVSYSRDSVMSADPGLSQTAKDATYPNVDAGIYYYSPTFFAGISSSNILGNPEDTISADVYDIPVSRQYSFQAGYKFLLSRSLNMVLEPSLIINTDGSSSQEIKDILKPMLKLYMENFCLGTYFSDFDKMSVFFQYKYPRFYVGTFFQLPRDSPFFKEPMLAEFTLGLNFSKVTRNSHW
jgi:type IX secretion system PorP/SprF family membrane protein